MRLVALSIRGFRSYRDSATIGLEAPLTTIVGENGAGKSTIAAAIQAVLAGSVRPSDFPFQVPGELEVRLRVRLSPSEVDLLLKANLLAGVNQPDEAWKVMRPPNDELDLVLTPKGRHLAWPGFALAGAKLFLGTLPEKPQGSRARLTNFVANLGTWKTTAHADFPKEYELNTNVSDVVAQALDGTFRIFQEFRGRSTGSLSPAVESFAGSDPATALLNMKDSREIKIRRRYELVRQAVADLLPGWEIDAVRDAQSNQVGIHFILGEREIPMEVVSAGTHQLVTLVANLVGRDGLCVVIEHPENHLHPHASRYVAALIRRAASTNQVIVISHDPTFVDPAHAASIVRVEWSAPHGSKVKTVADASPLVCGQLATALREFRRREILFARHVLVVEDESHRAFLLAIAPRMGIDLDAAGVSVVEVDGDGNYRHLLPALDALQIPYSCLKDKGWGNSDRYPEGRYFSLGDELEAHLSKAGLGEFLRRASAEVGAGSKRRVAGRAGELVDLARLPNVYRAFLASALGSISI